MKKIVSIFMILIIAFSILIPAYSEEIQLIYNHKENDVVKFDDLNLEGVIRSIINKPEGHIFIREIKDIRKLHADGKNIVSLGGLENLINLEELSLSKNNIIDISPIAHLYKLKYLNLCKNNVRDIEPIKNLTNLEQLDLDSNQISNIESLKELHNLKALRIGSNRLTNIEALANLKNLEYLCLWANRIENIEPIKSLEKLTRLRLAYNEIYDITPLANLQGLQNVNLNNNKISDINPLINLINLKALYLMNNELRNVESLKGLVNLERLRLDSNYISNIEGLKGLKNLKLLTLSKNNISDIKPLKEMTKLECLDLKFNEINDIDALKDIISLQKLFLDENNVFYIDALNNKSNLIALSLSNNYLFDISPLHSLINLKYLDLSNNSIKKLESLKSLISLESLYLDNNYITDITPLKENIALKTLSLKNNDIKEIESIVTLTNLENLNLTNNQIKNLSPLYSLYNLDIIKTFDYLSSNDTITVEGKVTDLYNDEIKGADTYVTIISLKEENRHFFIDVTDKYGEFKIQGVSPGEYKIVFTQKGYKPLIVYKTIDSNNREINVKMDLDTETNWLRKETEKMVYNYKEGIKISDFEIRMQENRLKKIEEFFDIEMKEKMSFYICLYPEEIYELAYNIKGYYTLGTYKASTNSVYTIGRAFDFHETCHAVEYAFNPNYNKPLGEGLSIYFGSYEIGLPLVLNRPVNDLTRELMIKGELKDIKELLRNFSEGNDYIATGSLVTFLLEKYSVQQFRDLFETLPNRPTEEKMERVFKKVYGKTLEEIQKEWLNYIIEK